MKWQWGGGVSKLQRLRGVHRERKQGQDRPHLGGEKRHLREGAGPQVPALGKSVIGVTGTGPRSPVSTTVIDETAVSSFEVNDVKFDPLNGNRLASASDDKTIKLWDLSSGTCQATLQGHR